MGVRGERLDALDQLIHAFRAVDPQSDAVGKLDVLLDLERPDDPRAVAFLLEVLRDAGEPEPVRIEVLTRLRQAQLTDRDHRGIGRAIRELMLAEPRFQGLRRQAALALGGFTDVDGVVDALGLVLTDVAAPIELRYNAFTSLYLEGPTAESLELLRALRADETFGRCAGRFLGRWGSDHPE